MGLKTIPSSPRLLLLHFKDENTQIICTQPSAHTAAATEQQPVQPNTALDGYVLLQAQHWTP